MKIENIVKQQKEFFNKGLSKDINFRIDALKKLHTAIVNMESEINAAICEDLGKSVFESYMTEIGMVLSDISYMQKHIKYFAKKRRVATPITQFCSSSYVLPSPYGTVLIISPWNYPFMLTLGPLVAAIATGNTAIVKPSEYSPATSKVIKKLIESCFATEYITVINGGKEVSQELLEQKFDYIFFTGNKTVGRIIMDKASKYLTPVTLELGGKSPCIVDETANLKVAADRIVFGKYLNCGQTCVAPDYLLVKECIKEKLTDEIKKSIIKQYGKDPLKNNDYGKIINDKHFNRIIGLMDGEKVLVGGHNDGVCRIEPTVLDNITIESKIMQEEIFGPILPVLTYGTIDEVASIIEKNPTPLALYLFTTNKATKNEILNRVSFGGGCVNDTIIHLATNNMGFGGVGESGIGSYHGKKGFDTFTHYKSIVDKKSFIDISLRYQPYSNFKIKLLRMFLK
jgi:aldehyde dehydrogenase (NAD+)